MEEIGAGNDVYCNCGIGKCKNVFYRRKDELTSKVDVSWGCRKVPTSAHKLLFPIKRLATEPGCYIL